MADPAIMQELKHQLMAFRITELQVLLAFAGKNKTGRKSDLQARALNLLQKGNLTINVQNKIRELHRQRCCISSSTDPSSYTNNNSLLSSQHVGNASHNNNTTLPNGNSNASTTGSTGNAVPNQSSDYYFSMPRGLSDFSNSATPNSWSNNTNNHNSNHNHSNNHHSHNSNQLMNNTGAVYADVKFKPLPFYDNLAELLKPAKLVPSTNSRFQESIFSFRLTLQQANDLSLSREYLPGGKLENTVQVQLRFCLIESNCEQEDNFPPNICVKVNSKICSLQNTLANIKPGIEPKRPSRPVNITPLCKISPTALNHISISWASEFNKSYAVGVFLVRKMTAEQLLQRIKAKGIRNSDYTKAMVKEKLSQDPDCEIATMSLRGSLICPLGKMRITLPIRSVTCSHIQCFDALLYLQMNEKKPTWICPVCDKPALFSHLIIDGLFSEIIGQAPSGCTEVSLMEDGSWNPVQPKKVEFESINDNLSKSKVKRVGDSSPPTIKKPKVEAEVITIDSTDDEDDDEDDDEENNVSNVQQRSSTPVLSSGSSTSETPNLLSLTTPDSSTESSVLNVSSRTNSGLLLENNFSDIQLYSSCPLRISGVSGDAQVGDRRRNPSSLLASNNSTSTGAGVGIGGGSLANNVPSNSSSFLGMNLPHEHPSSAHNHSTNSSMSNTSGSTNRLAAPYPPSYSNPFTEPYINSSSSPIRPPFPPYNLYMNTVFSNEHRDLRDSVRNLTRSMSYANNNHSHQYSRTANPMRDSEVWEPDIIAID